MFRKLLPFAFCLLSFAFSPFTPLAAQAVSLQTTVNASTAIGCPASTATRIVVVLPMVAGTKVTSLSCLILDPAGFVVDKTTTPPTVRLVLPPIPPVVNFMDDDAACTAWLSSTTYTLTHPPNPATSLSISQNGITLKQGADFTVVGGTVTFLFNPPVSTDNLVCKYRY